MDEDVVVTQQELASLVYPHMSASDAVAALFKEKFDRSRRQEFWSDLCWSE